jgi:hypothetical protein
MAFQQAGDDGVQQRDLTAELVAIYPRIAPVPPPVVTTLRRRQPTESGRFQGRNHRRRLDIATQPSHVPRGRRAAAGVGVPAEVVHRLVMIEQATDLRPGESGDDQPIYVCAKSLGLGTE